MALHILKRVVFGLLHLLIMGLLRGIGIILILGVLMDISKVDMILES